MFYTKTAGIFFECANSPFEKIEAINKSGICVLDTKSGALQFSLLIKGFEFEKSLMQEHFNENYMESDRFPKSIFKGKILNNSAIDYLKTGEYTAKVNGQLEIHGKTNEVSVTGKVTVKENKIFLNAKFDILLDNYNINVPSLVKDKISKNIHITVDGSLEILKR